MSASRRMYTRPTPAKLRRPPPIIDSIAPLQNGGFIAPIIAAAPAAYKAYTTIKPATKAKKLLDNSDFKKKHPKLAGVFDKVLDVGIKLGGAPVVVVKAAPKRKKQVGGKKRKGAKKK